MIGREISTAQAMVILPPCQLLLHHETSVHLRKHAAQYQAELRPHWHLSVFTASTAGLRFMRYMKHSVNKYLQIDFKHANDF